jgi:hypothetical protein
MQAARRMPPLAHFVRGEKFDIMKSEAAQWLASQPEIRQWLWNVMKRDGAIVLDLERQCWRGVDCPKNEVQSS